MSAPAPTERTASVWDAITGQQDTVRLLSASARDPVHAYLFVGPPGSTKWEAARAFAALLVQGHDDPSERDARLALAGQHPDVREVRRVGPFISKEQAEEIVRLASLSPVEGGRKVFILDEFHLLQPQQAATLLKTIEEPPPSTVFVVLADDVPPDLVTIASRCMRVDFRPVPHELVVQRLLDEGVPPERAALAAEHAGGNLDRARLLAADEQVGLRRQAFDQLPFRLDGSGAVVVREVRDLLGLIDQAAEPLRQRQAAELRDLEALQDQVGQRGGARDLETRHRRELRRHRTDELRSGLATLAARYREQVVEGAPHDPAALAAAVDDIHEALEALERNPNEPLLLQALLLRLPAL